MDETESYWHVGDEIYDKFDDEKKPYIILKVEDSDGHLGRPWMLTLDRKNGDIVYNNAVYVAKSGRQWDVSLDILEALDKLLEEVPLPNDMRIPKKLMTSQKLQLV